MPNWSHDVPSDRTVYGLPLRRTPPRGSLIGVITSPDLLGCDTHYWKQRTIPCERPNCEACASGMPFRWHSYCSLWIPKLSEHALWEIPAQAAEQLLLYKQAHGTLRGCLVEAWRSGSRPNGRVCLRTKPADLTKAVLPPAPDLYVLLSVIWNIAGPSVSKTVMPDFAPSDGTVKPRANGCPPTRDLPFPIRTP